ncbi:hypothetical protein HII31_12385 [Pseudocercospora fuligena]|uniref:NAD dependent epimerase/dehydratase n=1 Tax=Pseudocercospora fuligena TaxID=685502 RepID=A0A8H6VCK9_9PEZI|nr:hypothetical protein HII31_12385 [Pseudocercospora fuligena]
MAEPKKLTDVFNARTTKETYNLTPHPVTGRLIDNHPGQRTIPMKVLVLGASRTGTMSIFAALEKLGYQPYHLAKALQAPKSNLDVWREGLDAKYHGKGISFGRKEFDAIMGDYDTCSDVPVICFAEELIEAYPDAKIIINHRDVDKWLISMRNTAGVIWKWNWAWLAPWDQQLVDPFWRFGEMVMVCFYKTLNDFSPESPAREAFLEHYRRLRKTAPPERTLEYQVQDGWGPLCEFLGVPVPEGEFPRINDARQFIVAHRVMWWLAFGKMVVKTSAVPAALSVMAVAWYWTR